LRSIDQQELNGAFQAWVPWVQEVSQGNRDYVRWQTISSYIRSAQFYQTALAHLLMDQTVQDSYEMFQASANSFLKLWLKLHSKR
jgi:hypothetical protein